MKYTSIQYLRAVAAIIVVFHHSRNPEPWLYDPLAFFDTGQAGVDIFFVISGFIMYSAARSEPLTEFVRRRWVRIVPMYWIATLAMVLISIKHLDLSFTRAYDIISSLLFIPHYSLDHPDQIWPFLIPGWTLTYEAFFYAIFALGILTGGIFQTVVSVMIALTAAGLAFHSKNALWVTYTDPLLLEFLCGLIIARCQARITHASATLLVPVGLAMLLLSPSYDAPRVIAWGVPAVFLVTGALAAERQGWILHSKVMLLLGDSSYCIYLFQVICLRAVGNSVQKLPLSGRPQLTAMILMSITCACAVGVIVHLTVEKPIGRFFARRRASARGEVLAAR